MFLRKSKSRSGKLGLPKPGDVRDQVAGVTDDLTDALEAARDAIARALRSSSRRGATAGRKAGRRGWRAARQVTELMPEPEAIAEATRRATDKLLPARAKQRRKEQRKRRRRLIVGGVGLASLLGTAGMLVANRLRKRGEAARSQYQAEPAPGADTGNGRPASATASGVQQSGGTAAGAESGAAVTPLRDEGASAASDRRKR